MAVAEGKVRWKTIIENFYPDLEAAVEKAETELEQVKIEDEVTDVICEECGRNMVVKYGPHGKFLACPGFPDCRNTKPYLEKIGVPCPVCGKDVVIRKGRKREDDITAARITQNVNLCHGRSHRQKNVRDVVNTCWKKEINWFAAMNSADM